MDDGDIEDFQGLVYYSIFFFINRFSFVAFKYLLNEFICIYLYEFCVFSFLFAFFFNLRKRYKLFIGNL